MLDTVFLRILDMSKIACIVIAVVLLARLCLKRAPKVISYTLWAVVLLRLLCPVSIETAISILPETAPVAENYQLEEEPIDVYETTDVKCFSGRALVVASAAAALLAVGT